MIISAIEEIYNNCEIDYFGDMELWLDTADTALVARAEKMGLLHGVTTNPSIAAKSPYPLEELLEKLLAAQKGPVTAQVTAADSARMIEQAKALRAFSDRIVVKVPVTEEGICAIAALNSEKIPTMATAVYELNQVLLAARAGAQYIAPYFSRICEADLEGVEMIRSMLRFLTRYNYPSKLIGASIRSPEQIKECCEMGLHAVTINEKVFSDFLKINPMTEESLSRFESDWKKAKKSRLLS